jgi:hypothetical protein
MRAKVLADQLMNGCQYCTLDVTEDGNAFFNCSSESSVDPFNDIGFDDICTKADETECPFAGHDRDIMNSNLKKEDGKNRTGAVR